MGTTAGSRWWGPKGATLARAAPPVYRPPVAFPRRLLVQGEELVLDLRPHWIALARAGLVTLVVVIG